MSTRPFSHAAIDPLSASTLGLISVDSSSAAALSSRHLPTHCALAHATPLPDLIHLDLKLKIFPCSFDLKLQASFPALGRDPTQGREDEADAEERAGWMHRVTRRRTSREFLDPAMPEASVT